MAWLNPSWTYRLKLTSDNTKVPSNQTDIPLAIDLSEIATAHGFWGNVKAAGADIRITESDGTTEVPIEVYNVDTGAETGVVYFKADITGATDTDYYLYYGNSGASAYAEGDTYGQHNVWDSNYGGVYHLGDSTAEDVKDSTGNSVDESDPTASSSATSAAGKVGKGFDFNGSTDNIVFETGVDTYLCPTAALQFELWFNADAKGSDVLLSTRLDSTNKGYGLWFWNSNLRPSIGIASSGDVWTNVTYALTSINTDQWYKVVVNWDGTTAKMFVDNDQKDSYAKSGTIAYSGTQMNVGTRASGDDFDGTLDELWISTVARSDDWNTVIYNWQVDQSTFWTIGAEETDSACFDDAWTKRFKVTIDNTKVSADLTDYPVYVDLADLGSGHGFWSSVQTDGDDIRVTTSDEVTEVPVDLLSIDTTGKTGELRFKATGTLSSSADTDFWVYYGNASATKPAEDATYGRENVWTSYNQVYAMNGASATAIIDRTSNDRDVTSDNNTPDYNQAGKLGDCVYLDDHGGVEYLTINTFSSSEYTTQLYMSCWVKVDTTGNQRMIELQYAGTSGANLELIGSADYRAQIYISGTKSAYVSGGVTTNTWMHIATWWDGTTWRMFKDGSQTKTQSQSGTATMSASGTNQLGDNSFYPKGMNLDMVMISNNSNTMSNDWVSTTYNNENSPSTFYTLGAEEDHSCAAGETFVPTNSTIS